MKHICVKSVQITCTNQGTTITVYRYCGSLFEVHQHEYKVRKSTAYYIRAIEHVCRSADQHFLSIFPTMLISSYYFMRKESRP